MQNWVIRHIVFAIAILALAAQSLSPSLLRISQSGNGANNYLICASPDKIISKQSLQAAKDLAKLLGQDAPQDTSQAEHCSSCVIAQFAVLAPMHTSHAARLYSRAARAQVSPLSQRVQTPRGPPLGGRAPPFQT